jgi:predicted transcriptional regulator
MGKRITIMLDDDLNKKLHLIQAKAIQSTTSSVSYSKVINETIRKQLK